MFRINTRVHHNHKSYSRIGAITDVIGDQVRVKWDDTPSVSRLTATSRLTAVEITNGATVVSTSLVSFPLAAAHFPPFGVVTGVSLCADNTASCCTVVWEDRTTTTQPVQDVYDINWLPAIALGDHILDEWLSTFQTDHNVDLVKTNHNMSYRCRRNEHIMGCKCHAGKNKRVLPGCKCSFRVTVSKENTIKLCGRHDNHIPGNNSATIIYRSMTVSMTR
jgi:hypothetical protein